MKNLHESVHLTNNSIQKYYLNCLRDPGLPEHNMWLLRDFIMFLNSRADTPNMWQEKIYPAMKRNLLAIILASLEDTDLEFNTFEMNGCDFLIGEDFNPILLEINANPDLSFSTKTTRDICPRVMEDLVKGEKFNYFQMIFILCSNGSTTQVFCLVRCKSGLKTRHKFARKV